VARLKALFSSSFKGAALSGSDNNISENDFGANEWLVAEMFGQWQQDPDSVDKSWWPILERYQREQNGSFSDSAEATTGSIAIIDTDSTVVPKFDPNTISPVTEAITVPVAKTSAEAPKTAPVPADLPATGAMSVPAQAEEAQPEINILRGMAKSLASNMDASLSIPTATSVRQIPAKLLIDNRIVINSHLKRTRGGKISFTHLVGYAVVQALKAFPSQNVFYDEIDGKPAAVSPANINFGLAIDIPKPDGTRALLVPNIKRSQNLNFAEFIAEYEKLVKKARDNKLTAEDFAGTTISLTNPGGIGTVHSVPRLTRGQGCIVGVGALD
jgi:2-oxoglutarate dehydrogenase E1 component